MLFKEKRVKFANVFVTMWLKGITKKIKRFWYESVLGYNKRKKTYRPLDYRFIFDRWKSTYPHSWQYKVFLQYNSELRRLYFSNYNARQFVFSQLKKEGATKESKMSQFFNMRDNALTEKQWARNYNDFENWTLLNAAMALSSYFETYLSSAIMLSIESDPGILLGASKGVDGARLMKYGQFKKKEFDYVAEGCTKGEWSMRVSNLEKLFGTMPHSMIDNIGELERLRKLRNNVGHAFGRDIEKSRLYNVSQTVPIDRLSFERFSKWQHIIEKIVMDIDTILVQNHIGSFQPLMVYHQIYSESDKATDNKSLGERVKKLKRQLGKDIDRKFGKTYCRTLVNYYEHL